MSAIRRTPSIGRVLAAGALLSLVGCQQTGRPPTGPTTLGLGSDPNGAKAITPAQEADVQITMGRVAEKQGDVEQAMAAYRAALTRDASRADAHLRLAVLHDKQGKFRESAELYQKALALRPGDAEIYCDMGYSFYLQRRWAESEMNLRQAIALKPDHRRAHNNLALLLVRDRRLEDAATEFRRGGSNPVQVHMNLAFALTADQRFELARDEYERALALDPSSKLAKDRLTQLKAMLAKLDKPRNVLPNDTRPLTTSATAPQNSRPLTTPTAALQRRPSTAPAETVAAAEDRAPARTATPTASQPQAARPRVMRDPALMTTAATADSPRRIVRRRLPVPRLPAEGSLDQAWSLPDSSNGTAAGSRTDAPDDPSDQKAARPRSDARTTAVPPPKRIPAPRPVQVSE